MKGRAIRARLRGALEVPRLWLSVVAETARACRRAHPRAFATLLLLTVIQGLVPPAAAWVTKLTFDLLARSLSDGMDGDAWRRLIGLLGAGLVLGLTSRAVRPWVSYLRGDLSRRLDEATQERTYRKVTGIAGLRYFEDSRFFDTVHLAIQGLESGVEHSLGLMVFSLSSVTTLVAFGGILLSLGPGLALLVLVAAAPQAVAELRLGRRRVEVATDHAPRRRRSTYLAHLLWGPPAAKEIRLFGLGEHFLGRLLDQVREVHRADRRLEAATTRWQLGLDTFAGLLSSAVFVVVVVEAARGRLSLGDVTLYTSAVGSVQGTVAQLLGLGGRLNAGALFFRHHRRLMELPDSVVRPAVPRPVPRLERGIELRGVRFRYGDDLPWVLDGVDLAIPAGHATALVGVNGSGKTTLVKLLVRLYDPTEGRILWDGVDLREMDPAELRRRVSVIFQDFMRYALPARENVGVGRVEAMEDAAAIRRAAEEAGIDELLSALPAGYDTQLSRMFADETRGSELSGGQWQRVALARLLMRREAPFLILDEPTASLDPEAEHALYRRFVSLVHGRTAVLVSHRFSTVRMADRVVVLEHGRVQEEGEHEELLARGGRYAELFTLQAERFLTAPGPRPRRPARPATSR